MLANRVRMGAVQKIESGGEPYPYEWDFGNFKFDRINEVGYYVYKTERSIKGSLLAAKAPLNITPIVLEYGESFYIMRGSGVFSMDSAGKITPRVYSSFTGGIFMPSSRFPVSEDIFLEIQLGTGWDRFKGSFKIVSNSNVNSIYAEIKIDETA